MSQLQYWRETESDDRPAVPTLSPEEGIAIGENQDAAKILAGMIKQVNQDVQSAYTISGPPINELPKSKNLTSLKGKYNSKISKLQYQNYYKNCTISKKNYINKNKMRLYWWNISKIIASKNKKSKFDHVQKIMIRSKSILTLLLN